jgi:[ribosomal protein S18]-alanine N-acetyltransferase
MTSRLRPLLLADLPAAIAIEFEANPSPWRAKDFEAFIHSPSSGISGQGPTNLQPPIGGQHRAWVYADPEVRGFLCAVGVVDELELQSLAVERARWSMGVGSSLMEAMIKWAREAHFRNIHLEVREGNLRALQFYHRWGFISVGRRPNYYPEGGEAAILMHLSVTSAG